MATLVAVAAVEAGYREAVLAAETVLAATGEALAVVKAAAARVR